MQTIAIAGGGLMGRMLAWRLSRQGSDVRLYDTAPESTPLSAAYTAAAMIAPVAEKPLCHPEVYKAGLRSLALWPKLISELTTEQSLPVAYRRRGTLVVAHPGDAAELIKFHRDVILNDLPGESYIISLDRDGVRRKEPDLSHEFDRGFWLPDEAQIDNRALLAALRSAAEERGARFFFDTEVTRKKGIGRHSEYFVAGALLDADLIIDCRGASARSDEDEAVDHTGKKVMIRGVRGETLWVHSPEADIRRPVRLLHPRYHLYLVPRGQGYYQLGATELENDDLSPVSVRSAMEMLSALWTISPAFSEARITSMEANLRPATPDHRPVIFKKDNVLFINGLFRHGFLLAPAILERLEQDYELNLGLRAKQCLLN